MTTTVETEPRLESTSATGPLQRHIVKRVPGGGVEDQTLCGAPWDRLNPRTGEFCDACVEAYKKLRPGWPLPRAGHRRKGT